MNCTDKDCLSLEKELRQQRKPQVKVSFIDGATSAAQGSDSRKEERKSEIANREDLALRAGCVSIREASGSRFMEFAKTRSLTMI